MHAHQLVTGIAQRRPEDGADSPCGDHADAQPAIALGRRKCSGIGVDGVAHSGPAYPALTVFSSTGRGRRRCAPL